MVQRPKGTSGHHSNGTWATINVHSQVNIEHQMLGREGNVVEGKADDSGDSSAGSITKEDRQFQDKKAADLA